MAYKGSLKDSLGNEVFPKTKASVTYLENGVSVETQLQEIKDKQDKHKGLFATPEALNLAYPVGEPGWSAIVESTDTFWLWDSDTSTWLDSGKETATITSVNGEIGDVVLTGAKINASPTIDEVVVTKTINGHLTDLNENKVSYDDRTYQAVIDEFDKNVNLAYIDKDISVSAKVDDSTAYFFNFSTKQQTMRFSVGAIWSASPPTYIASVKDCLNVELKAGKTYYLSFFGRKSGDVNYTLSTLTDIFTISMSLRLEGYNSSGTEVNFSKDLTPMSHDLVLNITPSVDTTLRDIIFTFTNAIPYNYERFIQFQITNDLELATTYHFPAGDIIRRADYNNLRDDVSSIEKRMITENSVGYRFMEDERLKSLNIFDKNSKDKVGDLIYIPVNPNTTYTYASYSDSFDRITLNYYNIDKQVISSVPLEKTKTFSTTSDCYYVGADGLGITKNTYSMIVRGTASVLPNVYYGYYGAILHEGDVKNIGATYDDTELRTMIDGKVDKVDGKGLSTNDFTTDEKNKLAGLTNYDSAIANIEKLIPIQASETNQLADKEFVNSSIATNTADFRGTYTSINQLPTTNVNINDYAFVVTTDSDSNTIYNRYKYNTSNTWEFEYSLNNSSFTSNQWSAINSGATTTNIAQIGTNTTAISNLETNKADKTEIPTIPTSVDGMSGGTISSAVTVDGNIDGNYVTGTWLRTTQSGAIGSNYSSFFVNGDGWLYQRSKDAVKEDLGVPTKTSQLTNDSNFATTSQIPTNYVNTDSNQSISGIKTFNNDVAYKYTSTFYNANNNSTSSKCFGLYQWDDKFQYTYRNASNNTWLGTAFEVDGNNGVTDFKSKPTVNGSQVALKSEIPTIPTFTLDGTTLTITKE